MGCESRHDGGSSRSKELPRHDSPVVELYGMTEIRGMPLIIVPYYGEQGLAAWEWLLGFVYFIGLYLYFSRKKRLGLKTRPEYRHLLWGLFAKVVGGVAFALIYFFYYGGGDTIAYFYSALALGDLALADPLAYFRVLFGPNDLAHISLFSGLDVKPLDYIYYDDRSFMVVRIVSVFILISFKSYLLTTILLSSVCYAGIWKCYQMFSEYFPSLIDRFAVGFLYMPSVFFWGSGILKDTVTLSAACWWVYCFNGIFFKHDHILKNAVGLAVSAALMVALKPYILMALLPMTVIWLAYFRVAAMRNTLMRIVILPLALGVMMAVSYLILVQLGDELGKFSLDEAVETTMVIQQDMTRSEQYGGNYFNVGEMDGTVIGLLEKAPIAINAALFRPYLWESDSAVMVISGLENTFLLGLALLILARSGLLFFIRCVTGNPIVLLCIAYSVLFGFMIGITTPNFGALVRFKIPMLPFLVSGLFIIDFLRQQKHLCRTRGFKFDLAVFRKGEPRYPVSEQVDRHTAGRKAPGMATPGLARA